MVAILVLLTIILFLTFDYLLQRSHARKAPAEAAVKIARTPLRVPLEAIPQGIFFDRTHQWLELISGGTLKIGVSLQARRRAFPS